MPRGVVPLLFKATRSSPYKFLPCLVLEKGGTKHFPQLDLSHLHTYMGYII
jgi:hypothetical protein